MLIIDRTFLFTYWMVITAIIIVIIMMLLRLLANYADLNPFSWPALTIRRLTDPMIGPIRRALLGFGVDPKYAPLVTILLTILMGWFVLQLIASVAGTAVGVLLSLEQGAPVVLVGYILYGLIDVYILLILIRIIFSWGMVRYSNRLMRFLINATEPLMAPLRRIIPPLGMFDISPIVAFIILWLFQAAIQGTLLRGAQVHMFG